MKPTFSPSLLEELKKNPRKISDRLITDILDRLIFLENEYPKICLRNNALRQNNLTYAKAMVSATATMSEKENNG